MPPYTPIAVLIIGIWLIIRSQTFVSPTVTLIVGIAATVLAGIDVVRLIVARRPAV